MLQAKSKNRAAALAPFEQQNRDGVRSERPPPRAGRPPPRTVGGTMGAACHFNMGATSTLTHLFVASALDDNSTNVNAAPFGFKARLDHLDAAISELTEEQVWRCVRGTLPLRHPSFCSMM